MKGLTIGQMLGIHPLYSNIPARYQYFSRLYNKWMDAESERDMNLYKACGYKTRSFFT